MNLELRRVILFTANLGSMTAFYGEVLGLELVGSEDGWRDFAAGVCRIALHQGKAVVGTQPPKLAFYVAAVEAVRAELVGRGLRMGKVYATGSFEFCDFKDPDGNKCQISSRI